jgi:hypothetical protein
MNYSQWLTLVIARCAKPVVAIQLDCFLAAPRNDRIRLNYYLMCYSTTAKLGLMR